MNLQPYTDPQELVFHASTIADEVARQTILTDYLERLSPATQRRQKNDLTLFEKYLAKAGVSIVGFADDLSVWQYISFGLVEGFKRWLLQEGYAIGSINVCLATIKAYADQAARAGYIPSQANALIKTVKGYKRKEGRNVDEQREKTRKGTKKSATMLLSSTHVELIKKRLRQDENYLSPRDYLLFCLLTDHGLRCGEIAELEARNIDILTGMMVFYRRKVDKEQTHRLTPDTLEAATNYFKQTQLSGRLFEGYRGKGISTRAINTRVSYFGKLVDIEGLSPHDLRHYWATEAIRHGTDIASLQQAGGWNSPVMPLRYVEESKIANEGVKLS